MSTNLAVTALHLVKRCHSSKNDLYSMSLSSNLFNLSQIYNAFLEEEEFDFRHLTNRAHKAHKMKLAGFCYIKGRTVAIGAYQQTCEPHSVDLGSERPDGDSQLEIFLVAHSLESDNSDRLSLLTFTPLRSPVSSQNNSENICFVPLYTSWVIFLCGDHRCGSFSQCER